MSDAQKRPIRRVDLSFDEFLAGTIALSDVEMGIYFRACLLIYSGGGRVHNVALRRLCTSDPRVYRRVIGALLESGKLVEDGAYFVNSRCTVELEFARNRSRVAAENVSRRWNKPLENNETPDTDVIQGGNANHQPSTINHQPSDSPQPPSGGLSPSKAGGATSDPDSAIPAQMAHVWREECGDILRVPTKLNDARQKSCKARWHDSFGKDLEQWRAHCRAIRRSPFLCGETENNNRNWRADFDWALTPRAILGVAEGKYASATPPPVPPTPPAPPLVRLVTIRGRTVEDTSGLSEWDREEIEDRLYREREPAQRCHTWTAEMIREQRAVMVETLKYPPESADEILGKPKDSKVPGTAAFAAEQAENARRCAERLMRGAAG